jgi:cytochrome P450
MEGRTIVDFDQHSADYAAEPWETARNLAAKCPVAWSENHGGFWVVSGFKEVREVARNGKAFSSRHDLPTGCSAFKGVNIPPAPGRYLPIESDGPEHLSWRRGLAPHFNEAMAAKLRPLMEQFCTWSIDQCAEKGAIDLVMDFSSAVPAMVTLHLLGLPLARWRSYVEITHKVNYTIGEERDRTFGKFDAMLEEVAKVATERRKEPRDDLLTVLSQMEVGGNLLSIEDMTSACGTIIAGGIDTTSAVVASALKYLGENASDRQLLIDDPSKIPGAIEEFLRFVSPVTGLARTVTNDIELGGQQLKAGDRVQVMWHGANMDERVFENPTAVDFGRDPSRHVTFGYGVHRCVGSVIARADMPIMLSHILARLPDYALVPDAATRYPAIGVSHTYISMPATFTPTSKIGVPDTLRAQLEEGL